MEWYYGGCLAASAGKKTSLLSADLPIAPREGKQQGLPSPLEGADLVVCLTPELTFNLAAVVINYSDKLVEPLHARVNAKELFLLLLAGVAFNPSGRANKVDTFSCTKLAVLAAITIIDELSKLRAGIALTTGARVTLCRGVGWELIYNFH